MLGAGEAPGLLAGELLLAEPKLSGLLSACVLAGSGLSCLAGLVGLPGLPELSANPSGDSFCTVGWFLCRVAGL